MEFFFSGFIWNNITDFVLNIFVPAAMILNTGRCSVTIKRSLSKAQGIDIKTVGNYFLEKFLLLYTISGSEVLDGISECKILASDK